MDTKPIWESKTFWVNVLTGVSLAIATAVASPDLIPPDAVKYVVYALAIVNIVLRLMSGQPVSMTDRRE